MEGHENWPIPQFLPSKSIFRLEIGRIYEPLNMCRGAFLGMPPATLKQLQTLMKRGVLKISITNPVEERKESVESNESGIESIYLGDEQSPTNERINITPEDLEPITFSEPTTKFAKKGVYEEFQGRTLKQIIRSNKLVLILIGIIILLMLGGAINLSSSYSNKDVVACANGEMDCYSLAYTITNLQYHNMYSYTNSGCLISENHLYLATTLDVGYCTGMDQLRRSTVSGLLKIFGERKDCTPLTIYSGSEVGQQEDTQGVFSGRNGWRVKIYYYGSVDDCLDQFFKKQYRPVPGYDKTFCTPEGTVAHHLDLESGTGVGVAGAGVHKWLLVFGTKCDMENVGNFNDDKL